MASSFPSYSPPSAGAAVPNTPSSYPVTPFVLSLLIIAALLTFVLVASVSIHLLLRSLSSSPSFELPQTHRDDDLAAASSADAATASRTVYAPAEERKEEEGEEKQWLIESLPRFTMASALAVLPKSSPDCAVCISPFTPDAELRLLPACRHAFHAACVDAWLCTTPTCPLCRATVSIPCPSISDILATEQLPSPEPRSMDRSRSFRIEMGNISNRGSSMVGGGGNSRTYSLGSSFDYRVDEEVEVVVSRMDRVASTAATIKEEKPVAQEVLSSSGEAVAEAAGSSSVWPRDYVDRLSCSSSSFTFSGRWSQSHRQEEPWLWDTEAVSIAAPGSDDEETAFMVLYRWITAV